MTTPRALAIPAGLALLAALLAALVALTALVAIRWAPLVHLDVAADASAHADVTAEAGLLYAARVVTAVGAPLTLDVITVVGAVVLLLWRRWRLAIVLVVVRLGSLACESGFKDALARPRPEWRDPVAVAAGYSYPSGHATGAAAVYGVLLVLAWPALRRGPRTVGRRVARALAGLLVAAVVAAVAASRVLLGVHYPSDVTGGVLLGALWALAPPAAVRAWRAPAHTT